MSSLHVTWRLALYIALLLLLVYTSVYNQPWYSNTTSDGYCSAADYLLLRRWLVALTRPSVPCLATMSRPRNGVAFDLLQRRLVTLLLLLLLLIAKATPF